MREKLIDQAENFDFNLSHAWLNACSSADRLIWHDDKVGLAHDRHRAVMPIIIGVDLSS